MNGYLSTINDPGASRESRLEALRAYEAGLRSPPSKAGSTGEINNHIHTIYSFSPYTPSMAALKARDAGLEAAGSVDHDSIGAAREMTEACAILGIGGCVGFELRVSFKSGPDGKRSPFANRKINNPDSLGLAYMTVQGVPSPAIDKVGAFLAPIQARRNDRTRRMTEAINSILKPAGFRELDFERDVLGISKAAEGGGVTERHLLSAMASSLIEKHGKSSALAASLEADLKVPVPAKIATLLADPANPHYLFDLLGILKAGFLERVFIQPDGQECIPAKTVVDFARSIGAIPAYAYLGDVGESPTGDKKAEKFEDDYLDELFAELIKIGYKAVAYMPPRNTVEQLKRVQKLCADKGLMEISGVDINSSRQSFNCPEVLKPEFRHLVGTTWALIAHERLCSVDPALDLFSPANPLAGLPLAARIDAYAKAGRALDPGLSGQARLSGQAGLAGQAMQAAGSAATVAEELRKGRYSR